MFNRRHNKHSFLVLGTVLLVGAVTCGVTMGYNNCNCAPGGCGCHPSAPPACAADGVCRPLSDWGVATTRWRRWPSDAAAQGPTTPDGELPSNELKLTPFVLPDKEQEDLRGPVKVDPPETEEDSEGDAQEGPAEVQMDPGFDEAPVPQRDIFQEGGQETMEDVKEDGEELDIFEFGERRIQGPVDDAPPSLPASLEQASLRGQGVNREYASTSKSDHAVAPAIRRQTSKVQLVNPASAVYVKANGKVQKAVFVGDLPETR